MAIRASRPLWVTFLSEGRSSARGQAEAFAEAYSNALVNAQMHVDYPRLEPDLAGGCSWTTIPASAADAADTPAVDAAGTITLKQLDPHLRHPPQPTSPRSTARHGTARQYSTRTPTRS